MSVPCHLLYRFAIVQIVYQGVEKQSIGQIIHGKIFQSAYVR